MNQEEKIKELQDKIYDLSADINSSLHQLRILQADLDTLRQATNNEMSEKPVDLNNKNAAISPSSSFPRPLGIENFIGLKLMHLAGIIVLVTGISIGVKYAIDKQLISEGMRILLAYSAGILLFILSLRLKKRYQFLPAIITFLLMAALTVYTVITAISYDRKEIQLVNFII